MDAVYRVANNTIFKEPLNVKPVISLSKRLSSQIYEKKSKPTLLEQPEFVPVENKDDFYFLREKYIITNLMASRQYIDINFVAVPQSVSFKIQGHAAFLYDRDYVVTKNASGKLKAFARVVLNDQITLSSLKVYDSINGLFVGYPNEPKKEGEEYHHVYHPITKGFREYVQDEILKAYEQAAVAA